MNITLLYDSAKNWLEEHSHLTHLTLPALVSLVCILMLGFQDADEDYTSLSLSRNSTWGRGVTYAFVHEDANHLIYNAISLAIGGVWFEIVHGTWAALSLFLVSCSGAGLVHCATNKGPVIGMSAVVVAFLAAQLATMLLNWTEMPLRYLRALCFTIALSLMLVDDVHQLADTKDSSRFAVEAHIVGAIVGLMMTIVIGKNINIRDCELHIGAVCYVLVPVCFLIIGIVCDLKELCILPTVASALMPLPFLLRRQVDTWSYSVRDEQV